MRKVSKNSNENSRSDKPAAVVLVSGGLDSATTLALAKEQGFRCYALSFDYGQSHSSELLAAKRVVDLLGVEEHKVVNMDMRQFGGSALTDSSITIPDHACDGIPVTYVPARNTIFLSIALGWAEVKSAEALFIGVNAVDYSGYPDCRPEFISAFEKTANLATKAGVEGAPFHIYAPLINMTKAEIIQKGSSLGVDFSQTISCYAADKQGLACGICDSCRLRIDGFKEAGILDPTKYRYGK